MHHIDNKTKMPPIQTKIDIRVAQKEDAEALAKLMQELLTFYGMPLKDQRSYMVNAFKKEAFQTESGLKIFVALNEDNHAGFLAFSEIFALASCQQSIFIQDLFVKRSARGLGIGQALMKFLILHAKQNDISQIDWTADNWNSKAIRFYEKIGPLFKSEKIFYRITRNHFT